MIFHPHEDHIGSVDDIVESFDIRQVLMPDLATNFRTYTDAVRAIYGRDIRADVLKVSHHGSSDASTPSFLAAVDPAAAVIFVGRDNPYGYPSGKVLDKLLQADVDIYRTDLAGDIVAISDGITVTFDTQPEAGSAGRPATQTDLDQTEENTFAASTSEFSFIGNKKSLIFHQPTCDNLPREYNRIYFATRDEVVAAGMSPCGNCKP